MFSAKGLSVSPKIISVILVQEQIEYDFMPRKRFQEKLSRDQKQRSPSKPIKSFACSVHVPCSYSLDLSLLSDYATDSAFDKLMFKLLSKQWNGVKFLTMYFH